MPGLVSVRSDDLGPLIADLANWDSQAPALMQEDVQAAGREILRLIVDETPVGQPDPLAGLPNRQPRRPIGTMKRSWRLGATSTGPRGTSVEIFSDDPIAGIVLGGVDHGWEIVPRTKKILLFGGPRGATFARRVYHKAVDANDFVQKALDRWNVDGFTDHLGRRLIAVLGR